MIAAKHPAGAALWSAAVLGAVLCGNVVWRAYPADYGPPAEVVVRSTPYDQPMPRPDGARVAIATANLPTLPIPMKRGYQTQYLCVPNVRNFGYFQPIWRVWPCEPRPDQAFPQSIGTEPVPPSEGRVPPRLPVEKFLEREELPVPQGAAPTRTQLHPPTPPAALEPVQPLSPGNGALQPRAPQDSIPRLPSVPPGKGDVPLLGQP